MMIATALLTKILHHKLAILVMPIQNMWEDAQMAHQLVLTDNGQQNVGMKFSLIIPINVVIQLTIIAMEVLMKIECKPVEMNVVNQVKPAPMEIGANVRSHNLQQKPAMVLITIVMGVSTKIFQLLAKTPAPSQVFKRVPMAPLQLVVLPKIYALHHQQQYLLNKQKDL